MRRQFGSPRRTHWLKNKLNEKANRRFDATALAALSRIFAREAALKVAEEGLRWVVGAGGVNEGEIAAFETSLGLPAIHRAQAGLISDMDYVADVLYGRAAKRTARRVALKDGEPCSTDSLQERSHGKHFTPGHRDCRGGGHSARCPERPGLLGKHKERPLQRHRS